MNGHLVLLSEISLHLGVGLDFMGELESQGLVHTIHQDEMVFISSEELPRLESMVRLHEDLGINLPGIEAITNLLERLEYLQAQVVQLNNQLQRYHE